MPTAPHGKNASADCGLEGVGVERTGTTENVTRVVCRPGKLMSAREWAGVCSLAHHTNSGEVQRGRSGMFGVEQTRAVGVVQCPPMTPERCHEPLEPLDAYWRAANFLSVGQIFLWDDPLPKRPLILRGCGWTPIFVEGHEPAAMHALMAAALDRAVLEIQRIPRQARQHAQAERAR